MSQEKLLMDQEAHRFSNSQKVRQEVLELAKKLSLGEKIAAISDTVTKLKRRGQNKDQGYKYLKIDDVVDAVRPLLTQHKLLLTPTDLVSVETIPDPKGILFKVVLGWTLEDLETGEKRTWQVPGSGWDYHDKGLYKAITGSRKYAPILIFDLPIGDDPEASGSMDRESAKSAQKNVAASKLADAAGRGVKEAVDQMAQIEQEKKILISRPEESNGHYIAVFGFIANPQLERFFDDTNSKRFKRKMDNVPYWKVPSEYEKGLIAICNKLGIEVEG